MLVWLLCNGNLIQAASRGSLEVSNECNQRKSVLSALETFTSHCGFIFENVTANRAIAGSEVLETGRT